MKQWTVEEVAVWLHCIGVAVADDDDDDDHHHHNNNLFKTTTGLDLCDIASRTEELVRVLGTDQTEKLLQMVEFTKSIHDHAGGEDVDELTATLENVILEKEQMEKELAIKNAMIKELEKQVKDLTATTRSQDKQQHHPEDRVLAMEHRHEQERRQMEEHQELETRVEELNIRHDRKVSAELTGKESLHLGKRHFKEQAVDIHRYY